MGKVAKLANNAPATIREAFSNQHPLHRMLGEALERLGGIDFVVDWAEENPTDFMRIMLLLAPPPGAVTGGGGGGGVHLHLHQDLKPGPLDGHIIEQD